MTTNEDMYMKGWKEEIPKMSTEELTLILSKEDDYNPKYIDIVKEELAKRPSLIEPIKDPEEDAESRKSK